MAHLNFFVSNCIEFSVSKLVKVQRVFVGITAHAAYFFAHQRFVQIMSDQGFVADVGEKPFDNFGNWPPPHIVERQSP